MEGAHTIAALFRETVTGTNGLLVPPKGWLQGVRALCDKYGILLICDEVMAGMGRTGKMYAFEHFDVMPDIVTLAKGLTSSYFPLGAMGMRDKIADHFRKNVFWGGLTYNSHPVGLATAEAVLRVMLDEGMIENAARMGAVMRERDGPSAGQAPQHRRGPPDRPVRHDGRAQEQQGRAPGALQRQPPGDERPGQVLQGRGPVHLRALVAVHLQPAALHHRGAAGEGFAIIDRGLEITDAGVRGLSPRPAASPHTCPAP
jgi:taurine--2-oxoglutarate transaminase